MANCNECLHGDVCERFTDNVAIICKRFKHDNDYAEVKHGEWVVEAYDDDNRMMIIPYIEHQHSDPFCSNCGKRALLNGCEDYVTSNYCPNCGAKMDLKEGADNG